MHAVRCAVRRLERYVQCPSVKRALFGKQHRNTRAISFAGSCAIGTGTISERNMRHVGKSPDFIEHARAPRSGC